MEVNKCYNENCVDTMSRMPDGFVDLTVTSPPYDGLRDYKGYVFDFDAVVQGLYRATKEGGVVVWVVGDATVDGDETGTSFRQALGFKDAGFKLHDTMIYKSPKPPFKHRRYEQEFEYMFVFTKGHLGTFNPIMVDSRYAGKISTGNFRQKPDGILKPRHNPGHVAKKRIKGNIWNYNTGCHHSTKDRFAFEHPAIFPEELCRDHIISWSNPGDLVCDPFMGSGTTAKMAILTGRNWVGSEIAQEYTEIIERRVKSALDEKASRLPLEF